MAFQHETIDYNPLCTLETCESYEKNETLERESEETKNSIFSVLTENPLFQSTIGHLVPQKRKFELQKKEAEENLNELIFRLKNTKNEEAKEEITEQTKRIEHQLDSMEKYGEKDREIHHRDRLRRRN